MALKQTQMVALVAGKKTRHEKAIGDFNKMLQKPILFNGEIKKFQKRNENDDSQEGAGIHNVVVQQRVDDVLTEARASWSDLMDAVATQENTNCTIRADVKVDNEVILKSVPVTMLFYLKKRLHDIYTFVENMPTLDPAYEWKPDDNRRCFVTEPTLTTSTKKIQKSLILVPVSDKFPGQAEKIASAARVANPLLPVLKLCGHVAYAEWACPCGATYRQDLDEVCPLDAIPPIKR